MKIDKFKIEEWMNKYEASADYDLSATCISPFSLEEFFDLFDGDNIENIYRAKLTYGDIQGSNRLKNAIKSLYESQETKNITVTHGAIGANQLVFLSLIEPKDEVVVVLPTYQQHYSIPKSLGAEVKKIYLNSNDEWKLDINELKNIVNSKTKLICINTPNNPTGAVLVDEELNKLIEIAKEYDLWILSDEAYRGLNLFGAGYSKSVADLYDKGISVGSMSKTYSLPGIRVGWVCSDEKLIREINHQREYNTISVSILDDYIASIALEHRQEIQERNLKIVQSGYHILEKWIEKEPLVSCILPKGGTTAFVKYHKDIPSREFCLDLQEKTGVATLPGETLDLEGYFRVGFCIDADELDVALKKISDYLHSIT
ncbi:MAG: aminotransferase class I/II-fold pyridoxal phosphate-dependent enzyme [Candidatus Gastranaerophilales bacterium]|nr:aminotransferase class I/II-fold pyridoxal phosphate-dependent enzyme [Candidatus Gastranaerophilales bacterium]